MLKRMAANGELLDLADHENATAIPRLARKGLSRRYPACGTQTNAAVAVVTILAPAAKAPRQEGSARPKPRGLPSFIDALPGREAAQMTAGFGRATDH